MFGWLKKINSQIKDINATVNTYKEETGNQTLPSVANLNRAKKLIEKNKLLEAKDLLYETIVIAPKDALIYKYLGECEEKLGNINGALDAYKESSALNPQDKNIWHKLGLVYINLKKYEDAEIAFEKADKVAPINTDIQTGWGMSLLKQQKYPQALEKFIKATQINRYNFSALLLAAIVEIRLKKYDDADVKLNFLNQVNPSEGSNYEYANLCFLREKYDDSIRYAKKSLELNPNMFPAYVLLGKLYSMKFDLKNSIDQFIEAEKRELINPSLYSEWGYALVRLCRFSEAIEKFEKALSEDSANNDTKSGIALCYAELGNIDEAQNILNFLGEQNFKNNCTETANAIIKMQQSDFEGAIAGFKNLLKENPKDYFNLYRLAKCYEKTQNRDMVKDSYDKFLKHNSEYAPAYLDYARFLMSIEDYKDAQRKLRKAETLDKNNQEILNLLFYISYILVKENVCEYNVKEAISIANRTEDFKYPDLRAELEETLRNIQR